MNRKYSGFTLVEMLIVMGIIIILTVVGITAGRFAINRANDVAHRNAVDQVYTSLQAYYTDERRYPASADTTICTGGVCSVQILVGTPQGTKGTLVPYIDQDAFDGGSTATYFYGVGGDSGDQAVLVCVTLRGDAVENNTHPDGAVYCNGNGIGVDNIVFDGPAVSGPVPVKEMSFDEYGEDNGEDTVWGKFASGGSTWNGTTWEE